MSLAGHERPTLRFPLDVRFSRERTFAGVFGLSVEGRFLFANPIVSIAWNATVQGDGKVRVAFSSTSARATWPLWSPGATCP